MTQRVVIVGGGQAALRLRAQGYGGSIDILSEEPGLRYQRPPLSKNYLKCELSEDRLHLRPENVYQSLDIALRRETQALFIDRVKKRVATSDNAQVLYDKLILATDASARTLPAAIGGKLENVYTFRSLADADLLAAEVRPGQRLLVVGGGYIGLEMAAVAVDRGLEVTLIEQKDRILNRVAARETADWFRTLHLERGVDLREGVGLERLIARENRAGLAVLTDGSAIGVDFVVAGIGVSANVRLARSAGLFVENGALTNESCLTSDPDIYAIGDCAAFPFRGEMTRFESVQNACDQGEYVADHILGQAPEAYLPKPWFWSDQYDVSLKITGLNCGFDHVVTRPGERPGAVSAWYFAGARFLAVDAVNDAKAYITGKRWLAQGLSPEQAALADPSVSLKAVPASVVDVEPALPELK